MSNEIIQKLLSLTADESCKEKKNFLKRFKEYWPVVKPKLEAVKEFTGDKIDKFIYIIIESGDIMAGDANEKQEEAIQKFCNAWHIIRWPIHPIIKVIPGPVGKIVREFYKMADIFCDQYE